MASAFYQKTTTETLQELYTAPEGLPPSEAAARLQSYGPNALQETQQRSKWSILLSQFKDIMVIILIVAAAISFAVGEAVDAYVILAIILGNAWLGFAQENNAEESIKLLQKMSAQHAFALRGGKPVKLAASELVPGDILLLEAGNIVPADARLIESAALKTDEASLTGESHTIEKHIDPIATDHLVPGDQRNMVFKGTSISNGTAKAVVTATGMRTELGKIATLMETEGSKTPLQKRLAVFSKQLAVIVLVVCVLLFGFGIWRGEPVFQMFLTALSLAVAALPEALPAVITIALAQGARRMVKQNALVRKLPAVETLGSVTYICSDKTGTLTQNVMSVEKKWVIPEQENLFYQALLLTNDVRIGENGELMGDSTETALVRYALDNNLHREKALNELPLVGQIPFDSVRMRMSTIHQYGDNYLLLTKGAPATIAEVIKDTEKEAMNDWLQQNRRWAAEGLRVLFFAYSVLDEKPNDSDPSLEQQLGFLGMVAMIDPPREEVIGAIDRCKQAGIKTVMITGDQPLTAKAIADRLHMPWDSAAPAVTGAEMNTWTPAIFEERVKETAVYARVSPEQKLQIVRTLQKNGEFVAMTGDGVNDAPSLRQADIGIAMGITGTDVSKEAAEMILLDDNFTTIVKAVEEGRRIYDNIKKFILYVLSCNLAEIAVISLAPIIGFAIPLLPIHILWINLVTDGLPGLALVAEPAERDAMKRAPRPPQESLFAGGMLPRIVLTGGVMTCAALFVQWWTINKGLGLASQQTAVFTTLCFVQLANAHSVRSIHQTIFSSTLFANRGMWLTFILTTFLQLAISYIPWFNPIFKTVPLNRETMTVVLVTTLVALIVLEFTKLLITHRYKPTKSLSR